MTAMTAPETVDGRNPLMGADFPDVDVLRDGDCYYMVSTTMYFMPGCVILRSYDLLHWEIASRVYERLDSTPAQRLEGGLNIYAQGMWAPSLRCHKGIYYICFAANDTKTTYLFTSKSMDGPWEKRTIEGFYHDSSLLFDEDDRVYIIYGNRDIKVCELKADLSGPKPGGLSRVLLREEGNPKQLNYEGTHAYKINGRYYLFMIHSLPSRWKRVQACFMADSLEGPFHGGDILNDDMGYFDQGVAQGGIVQAFDGSWYSVLFQDRGAVGRIPVLVPLRWQDGFPVLGDEGKIPLDLHLLSSRPGYSYQPLYCGDDFHYVPDDAGKINLKAPWEWNHEPNDALWSVTQRPHALRIRTGQLASRLTQAQNTLTQRCMEPACEAIVSVDGKGLNEGDYAGLCALIGTYGQIALTRRGGHCFLSLITREAEGPPDGIEKARIPWAGDKARLKVITRFGALIGQAWFYYELDGAWHSFGGAHQLHYRLDHFTGTRFGLFMYSADTFGGYADFMDFRYRLMAASDAP